MNKKLKLVFQEVDIFFYTFIIWITSLDWPNLAYTCGFLFYIFSVSLDLEFLDLADLWTCRLDLLVRFLAVLGSRYLQFSILGFQAVWRCRYLRFVILGPHNVVENVVQSSSHGCVDFFKNPMVKGLLKGCPRFSSTRSIASLTALHSELYKVALLSQACMWSLDGSSPMHPHFLLLRLSET